MGEIVYDKPFKTYKEQIEILKNKYKLNIKNENFALELLSTISYYNLINGSKESFLRKILKFEENTDIIDLFLFKILDKNIQNTVF
ncbi:MAG: Abi family protein, partial [Leptotrichia wadei]